MDANIVGNHIFITFTGRWVEFGGKLLYCTLLDSDMNNPVYEGLVSVDGREARLIFSFDAAARTTAVIGVTYEDEDFSRIHDLEDGMQICVGKRKIINGAPENVFPEENTFTYAGEDVEVVTLSDGYYQYTAYLRDVYGDMYAADTAVVKNYERFPFDRRRHLRQRNVSRIDGRSISEHFSYTKNVVNYL